MTPPAAPERAREAVAASLEGLAEEASDPGSPGSPVWGEAPFSLLHDYRPGAQPVRVGFLFDAERLYALLEPVGSGLLALFLDPAADREGYLEISVSADAQIRTRIARRSLSGMKFNAAWDCPGAEAIADVSGRIVVSLPFASLGSRGTEASWLVGAARSPDFHTLRPVPPLINLHFRR